MKHAFGGRLMTPTSAEVAVKHAFRGRLMTPTSAEGAVKHAFRGRLMTPTSAAPTGPLAYFADALLLVGADGRIVSAGPFEALPPHVPVRDLRPCLLFPGFIDTHVHYPQTRIIGSASGPLLEWLEASVFPEEARFQEAAYARTVARELTARLIAAGTTTACLFSSSDPGATSILFEELGAAGLRAAAGLTLMDQECPEALRVPRDRAMGACEELADRWHGFDGGRLSFAVTPRFALSCSRGLLEAAARFASEHALLVQTHVAENPSEGIETRRAHPYADDYAGVYDAVGLLGSRTLLAHAIHLSAREWDLVASRGARVAHCPDSNFFLGSGRMRLEEARSRGVPVGLGSDVAAGRSFDMRRAVASAYDTALCTGAQVTPEELLAMATLGGARALGIDAATGSLEPGKDADFVVLEVPDYLTTQSEVASHVAFGGDGRAAVRAYVRGKRLGMARDGE